MPDLDIVTADGARRVYELLHDARWVLLSVVPARAGAPWADRVRLVKAQYGGKWELPVIGEVSTPSAVLIRPDSYVA